MYFHSAKVIILNLGFSFESKDVFPFTMAIFVCRINNRVRYG